MALPRQNWLKHVPVMSWLRARDVYPFGHRHIHTANWLMTRQLLGRDAV